MLEIKLQTSSEHTERELQKSKPKKFDSGELQRKKQLEFEVKNRDMEEMRNKSPTFQRKKSNSKEINKEKELKRESKEIKEPPKGKKQSKNQRQQLIKYQKKQPIKSESEVQLSENTEEPDQQSQNEEEKKTSTIKVRIAGGILLAMVLVMAIVHGFTVSVNRPFFDASNNALVGASLMVASIFVVLGFGLTLTYYGQNIFSSFFITLYIVSSSLIISPFLNKFFLNLFFGSFFKSLPLSDVNMNALMNSNSTSAGVDINYWNMKLALCCAISQLIIYLAAISRLQIYKIIIANFFFLLIWSLNYGLVTYLFYSSSQPRINDDFNICYVYLFGGFAGLIVIFDVPSRILLCPSERYQPSYPKTLSLLGIFFLWMSFAITFSIIGRKDKSTTTDQLEYFRLIFYPEGCLGMFFALSSSVLSTLATSIIYGQYNILKVSDLIGSTISGAIMYGPVAGFTQNLAIPITLGIASGTLSTIYKNKVLPIVNKRYLLDSMGFLGPFFVIPILGNFLVTPVIVRIYSSATLLTTQLSNNPITSSISSFMIVFFVVSAIVGMICGMMISWVMRVFKGNEDTFGDRLMFSQDLSLMEIKLDYEQNSTELFSSESSKREKSTDKKKVVKKQKTTKKRQSL